jgi:hypothetical protein
VAHFRDFWDLWVRRRRRGHGDLGQSDDLVNRAGSLKRLRLLLLWRLGNIGGASGLGVDRVRVGLVGRLGDGDGRVCWAADSADGDGGRPALGNFRGGSRLGALGADSLCDSRSLGDETGRADIDICSCAILAVIKVEQSRVTYSCTWSPSRSRDSPCWK